MPESRPPRENDWAKRHGLCGKRVFLYSGTLGFKHDPRLFLELASEFQTAPDVRIVIISEGHGAAWLARRKSEFPTLLLLPFQTTTDFEQALSAADVLLAVLEPEAAKFSVPSKVLSYMTAGKPILAAIAAENLAARTIRAAGAGLTVDPRDPSGLRQQARLLIDDAEACRRYGAAALAHAQAHFAIDDIAGRFEAVFEAFGRRRRSDPAAP